MGRIVIYTAQGSSVCGRLRRMLSDLCPNSANAFYDICLTTHKERFEEMKTLTCKETVPQIFFNKVHIGVIKPYFPLSKS